MKRTFIFLLVTMLFSSVAIADDGVVKHRTIEISDGHVIVDGEPFGELHKRAFLGVSMSGLTDELREYFGVEDGVGVLVSQVVEDGPAAKAGIKAGDVIIAVDGETIKSPMQLGKIIRERESGSQVRVEAMRKGTSQQFFATLDEREARRIDVRIPEMKWIGKKGEGLVEVFELGEGEHSEALDRMRIFMEGPEFKTRVERLRGDCVEYQDRLKVLEQRMKDLEKKLESVK